MKVAMIGLGKLGLPVSCAMVQKGHEVCGYDIVPELREQLKRGETSLYEPNLSNILKQSLENGLEICNTVYDAVKEAQIIFIAVPTPSLPDDSFNTSFVKDALREVVKALEKSTPIDYHVISIISTVLPRTTRNEFLPILEFSALGEWEWGLAYNAQFIAMGTTVEDMLNPEFVLIGEYNKKSGNVLGAFYSQLVDAPLLRMSIESAETVKMAYNTMIGFKIVYGNAIMEMCDKTPYADCEEVYGAISKATTRLLSPRYLKGGMGDGGGCHPRDNRALSFLARQLKMSADPFVFVMEAREKQSRELAKIVREYWDTYHLPLAVMGLTFKPETNLTLDSPALLLIEHLLDLYLQPAYTHDPIINDVSMPICPKIYVMATRHEDYLSYEFEPRSVIVDPWRMFIDNPPEGCLYRPIGIGGALKIK